MRLNSKKYRNPFDVPVTMLFYQTALNLKYNQNYDNQYNPLIIAMLLQKCLKLLDITLYPHVII